MDPGDDGAGGLGGIGGVSGATGSSLCDEDPTLASEDAGALFGYDHVPTFDISLPRERWEHLLANAVEEQWEQVEVCFEGKQVGTIALRFKGSYGTLYSCFDESGELTCPRLSMKLKFSEYDEGLRFFGLKHLNLNANRYDDSRMKEKLAYDLYRAMGVTAPRAAWAVVRVNGESLGLYGMVEELDGRFTEDRWPSHPDGNLYKELWPTDTDDSDITAALRTNEDDGEVSGFMAFSQAVATAEDESGVLDALRNFTDLDHWARYMAVDDAVAGYDGVTYFYTVGDDSSHNHNYYFYEDAPSHFTLVPWDVESTFWINPNHQAPHWTEMQNDCSLTYAYWEGLATAPACDPVFRALNLDLDRWRTAARQLLDGPFAVGTMLEKVDSYQALIGQHAREAATPTMYNTFDAAVADLRITIPALRLRLEKLIAASLLPD
jgi:spore coat protein CotH